MLTVRLIGQFSLYLDESPLSLPFRPAQALLAYLILKGEHSFGREELAGLFWPEATDVKARNNLRQNLWRIRQAVGPGYLKTDRTRVGLEQGAVVAADVVDLEQILQQSSSADLLLVASHTYAGELLPGFYDEWVIIARRQVQFRYGGLMERLLEQLTYEGRWEDILLASERWLAQDQVQESAFQALMMAYAGLGDRSNIAAVYKRCELALQAELNVKPSLETQALLARLSTPQNKSAELTTSSIYGIDSQPAKMLPSFLSEDSQPTRSSQELCVARESQMARLQTILGQSLNGEASIALISGEAGQGKSCLLREFARRAQKNWPELVVAWGVSDIYTGTRNPFLPFRDILGMLAGNAEEPWQAGMISREGAKRLWSLLPTITRALAEHGLDLVDAFVPGVQLRQRYTSYGLDSLPGIARLEQRIHRNMSYGIRREIEPAQLLHQYSEVLKAVARQRPVLLLLDDLHWADRSSLGLLGHLSQRLESAPVMMVGAYRPEDIALARRGASHPLNKVAGEIKRRFGDIIVDLDKQQATDARAFVDALLDSQQNRLNQPFRQMLTAHTEGHPLFAVELLRELQARGDLRKDMGGNWITGASLKFDFVPARVGGMIEQRIGRLDQDLLQILCVASILGERFSAEIIAAALDLPSGPLVTRISQELVRRHRLVESGGMDRLGDRRLSRFHFRHQLYQDYLLKSMTEAERAYWHERVADVMSAHYADDPALSPIQLAHHYREAGRFKEAASYLGQAGENALNLAAYSEAVSHFEEALALLALLSKADDREQLALLIPLGVSYHFARGHTVPEVLETYSRAETLASQLLDREAELRTIWGLWHYANSTANHERALELAQRFVKAALLADVATEQIAAYCLSYSLLLTGKFQQAREVCQQGLELVVPASPDGSRINFNHDGLSSLLSTMAQIHWMLGYPEDSLRSSTDALERARSLSHAPTLRTILLHRRVIRLFRREWQLFDKAIEEEKKVSQQFGIVSGVDGTFFHGALALAKSGQADASVQIMEKALAKNRSIGLLSGHAWDLHFLAQTYAASGKLELAANRLTAALEFVDESGERFYLAELLRAKGELSKLRGGSPAESERYFREALTVAREQQAKSLELRAAVSLARHWAEQGQHRSGYDLLFPVIDWFTQGFDTVDMQEAHTVLAQLNDAC